MLQSILATLSVFIVLYFLSLQHAVIIASIGATAFIVFAMPDNITAQAKKCNRRSTGWSFLRISVFFNSAACFNIFYYGIFTCCRLYNIHNGSYRH